MLTTISNKNNNCNKRRLTVQFHSDSKYPARDWSNYKEYIDRDKPNVASTSDTRDNTDYYYHFYKTNKLEDNMPRKEKLAAGDGTVDIDAAETQKRSFAREYIDPETKLMVIEEGSCSMCIEASEMNQVFYNPVQVQNRDLSILMLHVHHERRQAALNVQVDAYRVRRSELLSQHRKQQQELQSEKDEKNEGTVSMNGITNGSPSKLVKTSTGVYLLLAGNYINNVFTYSAIRSTDGTNWSTITPIFPSDLGTLAGMNGYTALGDKFYAVMGLKAANATYYSFYLLRSTDGITWTKVTLP